ncbi:Phosphopantetheine attachment site [Lachnospiraceae bacterium NE2001]|nr:Phosphopantetheine attachment site [Lachnospiraceae bacterium NE2001]
MDKIIEILEEIIPGEDIETCDTLVDDEILDSFAIISLVAALEEEYDITISPAELIPENFNSAESIWEMVERLTD